MLIQVNNTTDYFNYNFKCIFIAKIANVLYEATRGARWGQGALNLPDVF